MASKVKSLFVCSECGYESVKWYGKCPNCGEWNTMEEQAPVVSGKSGIKSRASIQIPLKLNEIDSTIAFGRPGNRQVYHTASNVPIHRKKQNCSLYKRRGIDQTD